jgi:hypothetical protein
MRSAEDAVRAFRKQADNVMLASARAGRDIRPLVADLLAIFHKESGRE